MYALHYMLPFLVLSILAVHLVLLHVMGSGSASTVPGTTVDGEAFLVYYYKDTRSMCRAGVWYCIPSSGNLVVTRYSGLQSLIPFLRGRDQVDAICYSMSCLCWPIDLAIRIAVRTYLYIRYLRTYGYYGYQ